MSVCQNVCIYATLFCLCFQKMALLEAKDNSNNNTTFDYATSKVKYFESIKNRKIKYLTEKSLVDVIKNLEICEKYSQEGKKCSTASNHKCYPNFELHRLSNGEVSLMKKRKLSIDPLITVLLVEHSFDVFVKLHINNNHCNRQTMLNLLKDTYDIAPIYVILFLESCNVCSVPPVKSHQKPMSKSPYYQKYYVDIVELPCSVPPVTSHQKPMSKPPYYQKYYVDIVELPFEDESFRFILFCKDSLTSYLFLRPLMMKNFIEIAAEMIKIILTFGPPTYFICKPKNQKLLNQVLQELKGYGLNHNIEIQINRKNLDFLNGVETVMAHLQNLVNESGSSNCSMACHQVQWKLNNMEATKPGLCDAITAEGKTPYFSLFGDVDVAKIAHDQQEESDHLNSDDEDTES